MVDPLFAETFVRIYLVSIVGTELPLMSTFPFGTRLSIFCKISSDTTFSELMSGTTSSCKTTFLYSMLDWIEPTLRVVVAFVKVLVGTGTSCPDAMIAFLLLLVKTVGRERILNLFVDSSRCTMAAKALPAAT